MRQWMSVCRIVSNGMLRTARDLRSVENLKGEERSDGLKHAEEFDAAVVWTADDKTGPFAIDFGHFGGRFRRVWVVGEFVLVVG